MSRFSDMVNAMRNNYGSSGNTAQPVNNVQVNYANQQAMIQRQEQARMREEERRRRLEEERRKREEERKRKEEERKAEEQRRKEQENIRAEEARAKAQKALEKSKENNFQQVQQPKQQVQQRSEETSASNARRLAQQSLGDNKQSVQRELANRALESSKSLEKSEQSIRRLEEKRNKEVQDSLDFSYAQKQNQEREKYRKEIENRVGIGREINAKKGWEEQARKNGYTDDDIQTAYYAWLSDVDNELSTIPDFMSREATVNRIMNGKNVSLSGSYDLNDPTAYLPKKKDGTFLHDSAVNIEDTVDNLRSGLQQWNANTGRGIANLVEAVNPESNYKENYDEQLINSGYYDRLQQLNNNEMTGTFAGRVAQGVGSNIMNALIGSATGSSYASLGMAGLGAYGGSSQNALERGLDAQKATEYGLLNAGVELGTELLNPISDYIPMVGKSIGLKDILGEGFEEMESALVEPLIESSYFGGNPMDEYASSDYWRNVAEQGLLGSTIALASNPTGAINGVRADINNGRNNVTDEIVRNVVEANRISTLESEISLLESDPTTDQQLLENKRQELIDKKIENGVELSEGELDNEFRRIQERSREIASETSWRERGTKIDDNLRKRLPTVLEMELERRNNSNGNSYGRLETNDGRGNEYNLYTNVDGKTFHDIFEIARTYTNNGELVDLHNVESSEDGIGYNDTQNYLSEDGLSGFSITPDGDLISVFNLASSLNGKGGFLRSISETIKQNTKTLDCYASENQNLMQMYSNIFGFKPASIMEYNQDYDHDDIANNHNNPTVVFMVNTEQNVEPRYFNKDQYDEAVAYRDSFVNGDNATTQNDGTQNFEGQNATVNNQETDDYFKPEDMFDENGFFVNPTNGFERAYNEYWAKYGNRSKNETEQRNVATEAVKQSLEEELSQTELADDPIVQDYVNTLASDTAERVMKVAQGAKQTARGNKKSGKVDITSDTQEMYRKKIESRENDVLYQELSKKGTLNQAQQDLDSKGLDKALEDFYKGSGLSDDTGYRVKDALGVIGRNVIDGVERTFGNRRGEIKRDAKLYKYVADSVAIRDALELQKAELLTKIQRDGYTITEEYNIDGDLEAKLYDGDRRVGIKTAKQYEAELNRLNNELANVYYVQKTIEGNAGLILGAFSGDTVLTPRMQLKNINDVVDKINIELHKKFRSQFQNGKLSDVVVDNKLLEQFRNAKTQEERNAIIEQIQENIASQIPATVGEKINALRYTNMLFNTGTFIRNTIGNAMGQGVYLNRDLIGALVEKYLDARGYVRYDKLNTSNEYDRSLIRFTQDNLIDVIKNDYADWKETGGNKRNFFKSRGYSGALLNKLVDWEGKTFNLDGDEVGLDRVVNAVANNLKTNKALVADDGSVSGVDFNQLVRDGYNQAQKQFIDSGELRFRKQGNTNNQIDKVRKVVEMLHGNEKTVGSKFTTYGNIDANTFEGGIRAKTRKKIFGNGVAGKVLNWATNTTDYIMNDSVFGDKAFTNFRNTQSLMRALNAQGLTIKSVDKNGVILTRDGVELSKAESKALIDKLDTQAYQDARESVYRDFNSTAQALNNLSESSTLYQLLFGGNVPFTTTPFNIIRRIVEFSPLGLANTMREYHLVQSGEISASTYINNLSKRMTGAGIGLLGAFLAHLGMIRAKGDKKDEKEHKYEVNNGLQDYSLVLPNGTYSLGWGAPATAILMYGAWVYELFARNGYDIFDTGNDLLNNWGDVFEPLTEMTMLSGLHDTIEAVGDDGLKGLLLQTVENYAGQFTPTMGSKINKIFDDVTRSTWSDNPIERTFRKSVNNIPLLDLAWSKMTGDHYLKPSLNNRGEEIKNVGGNALGRLAYNFLSPGTYKENTMNQNMTDASFTNVDDELLRLYESKEVDATKKQYLLPYKVYSFNVDGEKMNLTAQEKDEYNKEYLQNVRKQVEAIMSSPLYQNMTDNERANLITGVQNYYYNKIKQNYFDKVAPGGYNLSGANQAIEGLTDIGVEPYQVLYYKSITNMKDKDGNTINNSGALQVREAMESAGVYDDILNAYRNGKFDNLNSVGLNNKVAKMSDSEYMYNKELLDNGLLGATQSKTNEEKRESFNSAYEENQALEKKYSDIGVNTQSIYRTNDVKSKYDDNGKAITYSQDLLAREAMGEDFNKLVEAVQDGRISIDEAIKDTGIGKTVFMMSEDEFQKDLGYLNDGTWTNATYNKLMNKKATWGTYKNYSGNTSNTSSSSKSSGYSKSSSRKRSSGGTSSRVSNKVKSVSSSSKSTKAKASELSTYMKTVLKEQDKGAKSTGNAVKKSMESAIKNLRKSDQELYNEIMSSHNKNIEALRKELGLKKQ